jgi:aryl-alcohol dehydrogenase-like predicted oxidoreductase
VLEECQRRGIAFVPFSPLGSNAALTLKSPAVNAVAARLGCTPVQAVLAWALHAAPNVLLIPGTSSRTHFDENIAASAVALDRAALDALCQIWPSP